MMTVETERRRSAKDRVLDALTARGELTHVELNAICFRYGARIFELRRAGYRIDRIFDPGGVVRYTFGGREPPDPQLPW